MRIGHGYDVHRLREGRKLILGGVEIPYEKGLDGHSDADVLIHAVMDALLGAAALGDIGIHFPNTDETYRDIDSMVLLDRVLQLIQNKNYDISNLDITVIAQQPKLAAFLPAIKDRLATRLHIEPDQVNIKATTEEHLGFTGRSEGISCHAVCLLK